MDIDDLQPIYFPSDCNVDKDVFTPIARQSRTLDCMVGYFASGVLSELALSLSAYLNLSGENKLRFIVSPQLSQNDLAAIEEAYNENESFFHLIFPGEVISSNSLSEYTVSALAYLVVSGRIELKVAVKTGGLFHVKSWIFDTSKGVVAIHGSSNATKGGLINNFEQLVVSRSWMSDESKGVCDALHSKFESIWNQDSDDIETIPINNKTLSKIKKISEKFPEPLDRFRDQYAVEMLNSNEKFSENRQDLKIPKYIEFETGQFQHQGEAVQAWFDHGGSGILSIATGGGKTYISLIAASLLRRNEKPILIIVSVPTKALIDQWHDDIEEFGIKPVNGNGKSSKSLKDEFKQAQRRLRMRASVAEVLIVTQSALLSGIFEDDEKRRNKYDNFLIADEVHNLGSYGAQQNLPNFFDYKMGLSATPERQYDERGTDFILQHFGGVVYEFGLEEAIGNCLVEYNYFANFVYFTAEEEDEFQNLTADIKKLAYAADSKSDSVARKKWESLCIRRRALVESASKKVDNFRDLLPKEKNLIQKTIVFCTDKNPEQLKNVNNVFIEKGIKFHQVTAEETGNKKKLQAIIEQFSSDKIQALTSKRVLDEGFDVPQTEVAYFLASNTVTRQWAQRLGRVLRLSAKTGKTCANIYDFVVIPQVEGELDADLESLIKGEYKRIEFFSKYSSNYFKKDGGYEATQRLLELLGAT